MLFFMSEITAAANMPSVTVVCAGAFTTTMTVVIASTSVDTMGGVAHFPNVIQQLPPSQMGPNYLLLLRFMPIISWILHR